MLGLAGCVSYNAATGHNEMILISTSSEVSMGRKAHQQIACKERILPDRNPEVERLRNIGKRLVRFSDRQDYQYQFFMIDKDELNAFTIPGGYIYFYTGLFRKLPSDDAIAAVLAHEIGHCAARHTVKKMQGSMGYDVARNVVVNILAFKVPQASLVTSLGARGADSVMGLAMTAYSRHDEYEADRLGIKYLYLAGFDLNGMIQTFDVLAKADQKGGAPLFLRTHPFVKDRLVAVKKEMEDVKKKF